MDQLIADNMGLVYQQLHRFNRINDEDAYSYAMEGLFKAASTFDPNRGLQFSTYATTCIYNALMMYLRTVRKNNHLVVVSYNAPIDESDNDSNELSEFIATCESPEDTLVRQEKVRIIINTVECLIASTSSSVQRQILQLWWQSYCTMSQTELAEKSNTSQATVSRTLAVFRHKLRQELEEFL